MIDDPMAVLDPTFSMFLKMILLIAVGLIIYRIFAFASGWNRREESFPGNDVHDDTLILTRMNLEQQEQIRIQQENMIGTINVNIDQTNDGQFNH
ncbi:MAG: hypothetical protein WC375_02830 [Methanomassiliicoccales archaeon]